MLRLRGYGLSYREIGRRFKISRERVHQIVNGHKDMPTIKRLKEARLVLDEHRCQFCMSEEENGQKVIVHCFCPGKETPDINDFLTLHSSCLKEMMKTIDKEN